ncbi:iron(III) transport system substrate-binding protein [Malonomonas rubra DSM 5091]|uniref:Iron(III) transport system substrate-binding protein n=1 Tax=Malonomonas rubra DSM 5091 TaxID=1122189 RepID=A0A1M6IX21_MALRU|nr:extracellular solute-binding protein [Malonomonas rubra]SHJ38924.1 iron(III) transport system substrate-binding protein [Malonomonas rubra DSM 5091]
MKKLVVLLLGLVLLPGLCATVMAAEKVNLYANITAIEPIMADFNAGQSSEEGIYTRISTSKYLATVLTEFSAGKLRADVLQGPLPILQMLKEKGVLAPYKSSSASGYPSWATEDDTIVQFGIEYVAPIYNKELVKAEDVPTSYMDLTDPKWYDKIVMPDPASHATTISWLIGLKEAKVFGDDDGWMKFIKGLAANRPMFVKSFGPSPAPIESGEKLLGISMPKYIITKAPAPLAWARVDTLFGTTRAMALAAKAPNPAGGKVFIDYWLSKKAMQLLADKVGEYVLTPGVYPPIEGVDKVKVLPIRQLSDEEIRHWGDEFQKIFYQ